MVSILLKCSNTDLIFDLFYKVKHGVLNPLVGSHLSLVWFISVEYTVGVKPPCAGSGWRSCARMRSIAAARRDASTFPKFLAHDLTKFTSYVAYID